MFGEYSATAALGETTAKLHLGFLGICFLGLGPGFFCQHNLGTGAMASFFKSVRNNICLPEFVYLCVYKCV